MLRIAADPVRSGEITPKSHGTHARQRVKRDSGVISRNPDAPLIERHVEPVLTLQSVGFSQGAAIAK